MKKWRIIFVVLLILLVIFIFLPKISLISFFSKHGTIDPYHISGNFDFTKTQAVFNNKPLTPPLYVKESIKNKYVLGENSQEKRIEIDLTRQRLYAYQGDEKIYDFVISSGKYGRTPIGNFKIWTKLRYVNMTGGSKLFGNYYFLPNVPFTMFFYNDEHPKYEGYGIHAAYWHNNFGNPMSHGCINMKTEDSEVIYYWAMPNLNGKPSINATENNPGTDVIIYGVAPT